MDWHLISRQPRKFLSGILVRDVRKGRGGCQKELIKVKKSVDKRKLKSEAKIVGGRVIMEKTGEVIEGVEVVERGEKFKVMTND
jgi:hypothetical protein